MRRQYQVFINLDSNGRNYLSRGRQPDTVAHYWVGMRPVDDFILNFNYALQIVFLDFAQIFPLFLATPYIEDGEFTGPVDYSDYKLARQQRNTPGKIELSFAAYLSQLYFTLLKEDQFLNATKVLSILNMLNSGRITVEDAKSRLTVLQAYIAKGEARLT
jgi:hypothetical protein